MTTPADHPQQLEAEEAKSIYWDVVSGRLEAEKLKGRPRDCAVYRLSTPSGRSLILKVWYRAGIRARVRKLTRTSPMLRETHAIRTVQRGGVLTASVCAAFRLPENPGPWTEAMFLEDLGVCISATSHVKKLRDEGKLAELDHYLEQVISMTQKMVKCGILDTDHSFLNIVATPEGKAARLDFEIARSTFCVALRPRRYGRMLGGLVGSFAFTTQPDVARVPEFAANLIAGLGPSARVLRIATDTVERMLNYQRKKSGIDTRVELPWPR